MRTPNSVNKRYIYLLVLDCTAFVLYLLVSFVYPHVNLTFVIPFLFRDRGSSDDCIGTAFINLSSIAGQGGDEGKAKYTMRMIRLNRSKCYSDFIVFALNIF